MANVRTTEGTLVTRGNSDAREADHLRSPTTPGTALSHQGPDDETRTSLDDTEEGVLPLDTQASNTLKAGPLGANFPRGWPMTPRRVQAAKIDTVLSVITDALLFLCSAAFFAFAILVLYYGQTPTAENRERTKLLRNVASYGPTVFPILFAAVVGRATHAVLLWRLERGDRIGRLDTLATSTSLTSTFLSQVAMRRLSMIGTILLVIWALSPVGGQASLRQISIGLRNETVPAEYQYMSYSGFTTGFMGSSWRTPSSVTAAQFISAITGSSSSRASARDPWGNIKVPKLEHYEARIKADDEGWYKTDSGAATTYASLVGIPVSDLQATRFIDYAFSMRVPYLDVDCTYTPSPGRMPSYAANITGLTGYIYWNASEPSYRSRNATVDELEPFQFTFWPVIMYGSQTAALTCSVTTTYVEAEVLCPTYETCAVQRMRRSGLEHLPSAWTALDSLWLGWELFVQSFMFSAQGQLNKLTRIEAYLIDPDTAITAYAYVNETEWPEQSVISTRMGQLINSYHFCMSGVLAISGGLNNRTAYYWDQNQTFANAIDPASNPSTRTTRSYNFTDDEYLARAWPATGTRKTSTEIIQASLMSISRLWKKQAVCSFATTSLCRYCLRTSEPLRLLWSLLRISPI